LSSTSSSNFYHVYCICSCQNQHAKQAVQRETKNILFGHQTWAEVTQLPGYAGFTLTLAKLVLDPRRWQAMTCHRRRHGQHINKHNNDEEPGNLKKYQRNNSQGQDVEYAD